MHQPGPGGHGLEISVPCRANSSPLPVVRLSRNTGFASWLSLAGSLETRASAPARGMALQCATCENKFPAQSSTLPWPLPDVVPGPLPGVLLALPPPAWHTPALGGSLGPSESALLPSQARLASHIGHWPSWQPPQRRGGRGLTDHHDDTERHGDRHSREWLPAGTDYIDATAAAAGGSIGAGLQERNRTPPILSTLP